MPIFARDFKNLNITSMKKLLVMMSCVLLTGCGISLGDDDKLDITSKFNGTWNIYEQISRNSDGVITYHAIPWGGLVASVKEHNMPVDWSGYESVQVEFAEPTKVETQILVSDRLSTWGKAGITKLTCYFDGQNVTSVDEVILQAADSGTVYVKSVRLSPVTTAWDSQTIWTGSCKFGNWENGFVVKPEQFSSAYEGDKLELVYTTDRSEPTVTYWQYKSIYNGTEDTLEGNESEQNNWGAVMVGKMSTACRFVLTAKDVKNLKEKGLFITGFYMNVTQVNLLRKGMSKN